MAGEVNWCCVDDHNREHLLSLLRWLLDEVLSAGGDGDGLWYSRNYRVKDLLPLVWEINDQMAYPWEVHLQGESIHWTRGQEGLYITNDEKMYLAAPSWQQVLLRY